MRSAIAAALHGYLVRSADRNAGVSNTATTMPAIRPMIVYLTSSPIPSVIPR